MCRQGCDDPVGSLAHGLRAGREQEHDDAMHTGGDEWNGGVSLRFFSCPSFVARDCSRADCALGQQDNGRRPMAEGPARPREAEGPDPRGPLPPKGRLVRKPIMLTSRGGVGSEGVVARIATARACIKQAQCRSGTMGNAGDCHCGLRRSMWERGPGFCSFFAKAGTERSVYWRRCLSRTAIVPKPKSRTVVGSGTTETMRNPCISNSKSALWLLFVNE